MNAGKPATSTKTWENLQPAPGRGKCLQLAPGRGKTCNRRQDAGKLATGAKTWEKIQPAPGRGKTYNRREDAGKDSRRNRCQLKATSRLRELTEPAVFVLEVAKHHDEFVRDIAFGVLVNTRDRF